MRVLLLDPHLGIIERQKKGVTSIRKLVSQNEVHFGPFTKGVAQFDLVKNVREHYYAVCYYIILCDH